MRCKRLLPVLLSLALILPLFAADGGVIGRVEVQGLSRMTREAFLHALQLQPESPYDLRRVRARFKALWKLNLFEDITLEAEPMSDGKMLLVVKVRERPVLTSVSYQDTKALTRTEIEDRLKERKYRLDLGKPIDTGKIFFAESEIRSLLGEKGFLDAEVDSEIRKVTETTRAVHFFISSGGKTRILKIDFTGNELFSDRKLKTRLKLTQERRWWWPWSGKNLYHPAKWDQDVGAVREVYQNRGYLDVEIRPPVVEVRRSNVKGGETADDEEDGEDEQDGDGTPGNEPDAGKPAKPGSPSGDSVATADGSTSSESDSDEGLTLKQKEKRARKAQRAEEKARNAKQRVKRWVYLTVPVKEGEQYTLGEIRFTGNDKFKDEVLRSMIPIRDGAVLENHRLEFGVNRISRLYEDLGHLYATAVRRIERREGELVADVEVQIEEDRPYYVASIDFSGNSATHDRVLRREMLIAEGELFSRSKLDLSKQKINQLGYFQVPDEPIIEPIAEEARVKILIPGLEQGRNEIQIGGGYSGLDGAFFSGVYSTRNFLGRGQILSTAIQVGGRSNRYQISFQEPWFLNRPYRFGFSVFRRDLDFGSSLRSTSTGGGIVLGKRLGRFSQLNVGYNWESVDSRTVLASPTGNLPVTISDSNTVSSLTPVFSFNTINNPYRPSGGKSLSLSFQIAGGPLGGDTAFLKPIVSFTGYRKAVGSGYLAVHSQLGMVREWQGGSSNDASANIEGIPRFQRFWLGGDTLGPRVFETRSITPLRFVRLEDNRIVEVLGDPRFRSPEEFVSNGPVPVTVEVGGDRFFLIQTEYVQPLNEQAELAFFVDAGDTLFEDQSWGFETTRVSAGIELRFFLPVFPVPLRLIYGVPVRDFRGDQTGNFTFSIGRSF